MSFLENNQGQERFYNNADSFAMAFDDAWARENSKDASSINHQEKLEKVLKLISDHPFFISFPSEARKVAVFRIRLLNLE